MARWAKLNYTKYDVVHDNQTLAYGLLKFKNWEYTSCWHNSSPITMDKKIDIKHAETITLKILNGDGTVFKYVQMKVARQLDPIIVVSENTRKDLS